MCNLGWLMAKGELCERRATFAIWIVRSAGLFRYRLAELCGMSRQTVAPKANVTPEPNRLGLR